MKNILAENLLRFGVKNFSEADKQKVQEQFEPGETQETFEFVPLTIYVPGIKDQSGQWQFAKEQQAMFVAVNDTKSLERFTGITKLDFVRAGTATITVKSTKNSNGDLSGKFATYEQPALVKYLTSNAGKTLPSGDKSILVSLTNTSNATETLPASKTSFVWYDIKAPRQVQPK